MYEVQVKAGIRLLDWRLPGWRDFIDLDTLDLEWSENDVLGQVFGDFERGQALLKLSDEEVIRLGLDLGSQNSTEDWQQLTATWRSELGWVDPNVKYTLTLSRKGAQTVGELLWSHVAGNVVDEIITGADLEAFRRQCGADNAPRRMTGKVEFK